MRTKPTLCRPITVSAVSRYRFGSQDLLQREMQHTPRKVASSLCRPSLLTLIRVRCLYHRIYRYIISYIFLICKGFCKYFCVLGGIL